MKIWNMEDHDTFDSQKHHNITSINYINKKTGKEINLDDNLKTNLQNYYNIKGFKNDKIYSRALSHFIRFLESTNQFNQILARETENNLTFLLSKKSPYYMTFSQNFSTSGKIGLSYEFGFRNYLSLLEVVSFKAEKHIDEGNSFDFNVSFPFVSTEKTADFSAGFMTTTLFPEFKVEKLSSMFKINNNKDQNFYSIGIESNRPVFDAHHFRGNSYNSLLKIENNINATYGKGFIYRNRFFHSIKNYFEAKLFVYSLKNADLQFNLKNNNKFYLHQILPFRLFKNNIKYHTMEIENSNNLVISNAVNHKENISMIKKHYFNRNRGYHNIDSNIPFIANSVNTYNQIALSQSFKLNLKHFNLIQNDNCFPFFHVTNYFNSYNWFKKLTVDSCIGAGLIYRMNEKVSLELLYNFVHWSSHKGPFTKTENFQIRVAFDD